MRPIDADALLLSFADYQLQESPDWGANGYGNRDKYEAITECMEAVENAPTVEPETHWIPVSEQLPDKDSYYLTTTIYKQVHCDYWSDDHFDRTEMVIAWQTLPEPYKEENK